VATELDVPQHVLRFWETKFSQIRPMKRGGGRRYYRPEDVVLLTTLRDLLYREGYTIKGVQKLLRDNGAKALVNVVQERRDRAEDGEAVGPLGFVIEGREGEDDPSETAAVGGFDAGVDRPTGPEADDQGSADAAAHHGMAEADPAAVEAGEAVARGMETPPEVAPETAAETGAETVHDGTGLSAEHRAALDDVIADLTDLRRLLVEAMAVTTPPAPPPTATD
jgi:DNA-binding transcriptional MerR regulator